MSEKKFFMELALKEARKAEKKGEVPVGAVIVKDGAVIAKAHNLRETKKNALCHAEVMAIEKACKKLSSWRLSDCDMYVTLEPCHMCMGAIIQSKIKTLYYGAYDSKCGAVISIDEVWKNDKLCHKTECYGGIMEDKCSGVIKEFFSNIRKTKNV